MNMSNVFFVVSVTVCQPKDLGLQNRPKMFDHNLLHLGLVYLKWRYALKIIPYLT